MSQVDSDEYRLACLAAEILTPAPGAPARVRAVTREPSPFATLASVEVLSVSLDAGDEVRLFVKHLGKEQADHPDKQRRDRELRVYDRLLCEAPDLPVPSYYGSSRNNATGQHELYLEHVPDWTLQYHNLEHWFTAARRLAHLHHHFASRPRRLQTCDFLLTLDAPYFDAWAKRATAAVERQSGELARRLTESLADYGTACDLLARQPRTLVHNDLAPKNVVADRRNSPARICLIDWELAGVGCGLLDLVHLKYGLDADADREMVAGYRAELRSTNLLPDDESEFARLLAACELHKTLYRLAHSPNWNLPPAAIEKWVAEARHFMKQVSGP